MYVCEVSVCMCLRVLLGRGVFVRERGVCCVCEVSEYVCQGAHGCVCEREVCGVCLRVLIGRRVCV